MERDKGNQLIAEFMGIEVLDQFNDPDAFDKLSPKAMLPAQLSYEREWNSLMPVVEKIEAIGPYWIKISETNCKVMKNIDTLLEADGKTKIQAVWQAVIQFIQTENN